MKIAFSDLTNLVLALITGFYVFLTHRILAENRRTNEQNQKQFEESMRPAVYVDYFHYTSSKVIKLRIRNLGQSAATNLQLRLDRRIHQFGRADSDLWDLPAFNLPFPVFPPDTQMLFDLGVSHDILAGAGSPAQVPNSFTLKCEYDWLGRHFSEVTPINLLHLHGSSVEPDSLTDEVRELTKSVEKISGQMREVRADVQSFLREGAK